MIRLTRNAIVLVVLGGVLHLSIAAPAWAQPTSPPRESSPPSLDDLLGLTKDGQSTERPPSDIIEKLTGETGEGGGVDVAALFVEAIESMDQSATRLLDQRDAGLATQRLQEEAILKLDTLIAQAQQQQQRRQQPQSQPNPQQAPPGQQQQQQNPQPGTEASRGPDNRPPLREGQLDGAISETGSEWGNLPPRIRDLLRQGRGDAAARLYQRLTEIYYQRLAEESHP